MIGTRLLHYEVIEKLGEGGMGVVYKARDTHLDRFVAIKVLPPEKMADAGRKARFVQEAKAASSLNHPNIVTIHDISQDGGVDFIAMEFVEGRTLDQIIPRKGMRLNEALKVAIQIADALARAHAAGIIHRYLKPANIMVDSHGHVKVLDFGLAKLTEVVTDDRTVTMKTEEGTILSTAAWMSREQGEDKQVDGRPKNLRLAPCELRFLELRTGEEQLLKCRPQQLRHPVSGRFQLNGAP
jgi:serine/threonine protein kinase